MTNDLEKESQKQECQGIMVLKEQQKKYNMHILFLLLDQIQTNYHIWYLAVVTLWSITGSTAKIFAHMNTSSGLNSFAELCSNFST